MAPFVPVCMAVSDAFRGCPCALRLLCICRVACLYLVSVGLHVFPLADDEWILKYL